MKNEKGAVQAAGVILCRMDRSIPRFLLLKDARHDTWGFPKGHCDRGESLEETARRETMEETGYTGLSLLPGFHKTVRYRYPPPGGGALRDKEVHYFLARIDAGREVLSAEHSEAIWRSRAGAGGMLQHETAREVLHCAHSRINAEETTGEQADSALATALLEELSSPGDSWRLHSLEVGRIAELLAKAIVASDPSRPVDPDWVLAAGVLHDIGRSRDQGMRHPLEGFRLLRERGLSWLARPCLSHWLKGRQRRELEGDPHFSKALLDELYSGGDLDAFSLSEKIVALADSLVQHDRIVTIEERYREAMERYGESSWMKDNRRISLALLAEVDGILCLPVYHILGLTDRGENHGDATTRNR
jgi:bis(5'-nucleosidyl)-tetraphosphatase